MTAEQAHEDIQELALALNPTAVTLLAPTSNLNSPSLFFTASIMTMATVTVGGDAKGTGNVTAVSV